MLKPSSLILILFMALLGACTSSSSGKEPEQVGIVFLKALAKSRIEEATKLSGDRTELNAALPYLARLFTIRSSMHPGQNQEFEVLSVYNEVSGGEDVSVIVYIQKFGDSKLPENVTLTLSRPRSGGDSVWRVTDVHFR